MLHHHPFLNYLGIFAQSWERNYSCLVVFLWSLPDSASPTIVLGAAGFPKMAIKAETSLAWRTWNTQYPYGAPRYCEKGYASSCSGKCISHPTLQPPSLSAPIFLSPYQPIPMISSILEKEGKSLWTWPALSPTQFLGISSSKSFDFSVALGTPGHRHQKQLYHQHHHHHCSTKFYFLITKGN